MQVAAVSRYRVLKSVCDKSDFGHFRSSEQQADGCVWLARCDFLLVFYNDLRFRWNRDRVIRHWNVQKHNRQQKVERQRGRGVYSAILAMQYR